MRGHKTGPWASRRPCLNECDCDLSWLGPMIPKEILKAITLDNVEVSYSNYEDSPLTQPDLGFVREESQERHKQRSIKWPNEIQAPQPGSSRIGPGLPNSRPPEAMYSAGWRGSWQKPWHDRWPPFKCSRGYRIQPKPAGDIIETKIWSEKLDQTNFKGRFVFLKSLADKCKS